MPRYEVTLIAIVKGVLEAKDEIEAVGIMASTYCHTGEYELDDSKVELTDKPLTLFEANKIDDLAKKETQ